MRLKRGIGIAGSHGKTTTTGLVSLILQKANFDPTVVIGGIFDSIGSNVSLGKGDWLVAETDESDGSFLRLSPELAVVTNVDREHMDHYENFQAAIKAFADFIDRIPFYGKVILCADCPRLRAMSEDINKSAVWYGMEQQNSPDVLIKVEHRGAEQSFSLWSKASAYKECLAKLNLRVPGIHNILNATAAALVARELEVPWTTIATALGQFSGVKRRFEFKGHLASHPIIEDYAHHPTEIAATIKAALDCYQKAPLVLFQPHRYTRTRDQWEEFKTCFQGARLALTLEVYAASEPKDDWTRAFDREFFAQNIVGLEAHFFPSSDEMAQAVRGKFLAGLPEGTPILILGAGNIAARTLPILLSET